MTAIESREWKAARKFLRGKYGVRNIVSMSPPLPNEGPNGTWYARIEQDGTIFGIEFKYKGQDKWQLKELRSAKG
jgi:hypothetical protein